MSAHAHIGAPRPLADAPGIEDLARLGDVIGRLADPNARLQALVTGARELLRAAGCGLFLLDEGEARPVGVDGLTSGQVKVLSAFGAQADVSSFRAELAGFGNDALHGEIVRRQGVPVAWLCFVWRQRCVPASAYTDAARILAVYAGSAFETLAARASLDAAIATHARERDDFVCVASHELRSPLTALQLQLQLVARRIGRVLLRSPAEDNDLTRISDGVHKAVLKCRQLVALGDTLLDATRIESGVFDVRAAPCNLTEAINESIESLQERLAHAGCTLTLALEDGIQVTCDRMRIQQVMVNLLSNVIKYAAGSRVMVTLRQVGDSVVVEVEDRGPGIPEDRQHKIFERFQRTGNTESAEGWGLGLYIVRQIVDAHAGDIAMRSAVPTGSIFTVTLPRVRKGDDS